jgi:hypothetical protein
MGRVWVLDTETKGTGAHVAPLEKPGAEPAGPPERAPRRRRAKPSPPARRERPPRERRSEGGRRSGPLPPGHVRKKATGEIGRVRSVDPKAGTASVEWLKQGRTSTVPLAAVSRR